jgi:hypothetical protein
VGTQTCARLRVHTGRYNLCRAHGCLFVHLISAQRCTRPTPALARTRAPSLLRRSSLDQLVRLYSGPDSCHRLNLALLAEELPDQARGAREWVHKQVRRTRLRCPVQGSRWVLGWLEAAQQPWPHPAMRGARSSAHPSCM